MHLCSGLRSPLRGREACSSTSAHWPSFCLNTTSHSAASAFTRESSESLLFTPAQSPSSKALYQSVGMSGSAGPNGTQAKPPSPPWPPFGGGGGGGAIVGRADADADTLAV